jgi:hypothetical protein
MTGSIDAHDALTCVVRLWSEPRAGDQHRWRGRAEHVASQEVR